jgi:hypothetical protein
MRGTSTETTATPPTREASSSATIQARFDAQERQRIAEVAPWVETSASAHGLDPDLVNAVIWVESRFDPRAKSPAGARGLMQLMPATASMLAEKLGRRAAPYDPEFNIEAGSLYLAQLVARYRGDEALALAAYHAGPGNVDRWMSSGGLPPMSRAYVDLVTDARGRFIALRAEHRANDEETRVARRDQVMRALADADAGRSRVLDYPEAPVERAPIVPEPPPMRPVAQTQLDGFMPPVRYDLDRVESTYVPAATEEPPLGEVPAPREDAPAEVGPTQDDDGAEPAAGLGVLPSIE